MHNRSTLEEAALGQAPKRYSTRLWDFAFWLQPSHAGFEF